MDLSWWLSAITDVSLLTIIALAFVVGGLVKGLIGGGLPSIVVPVMAIVVEPAFAAAVTLIPVVATNFLQALDGRLLIPVLRRFGVLLVTLFVGVLAGSQLLVGLPPHVSALVIGVSVVVLSPLALLSHRFSVSNQHERTLNPVVGGVLGVLGGATVIFTPVLIYLAMLRLEKNLHVTAAAVMAICAMVPLYLGLGFSAALNWQTVRFSVVLLGPTMLGYLAGRALRGQVSQTTFQLILTASLVLIGIGLIHKGLTS